MASDRSPRVQVETDRRYVPALLRAQNIPRATNLKILHCEPESRAKLGGGQDGSKTTLRRGRQHTVTAEQEISVGTD